MPCALRLEHICISKFLSPLISYSNLNLNSAMSSNYLNRNEYITFFFLGFDNMLGSRAQNARHKNDGSH